MSVANRAAISRVLDFSRLSFSFFRSFSTSPPSSSSSNLNGSTDSNKNDRLRRKKKKKKNLFDVARFLPSFGVGCHVAKTHWAEVSYQITEVNMYKNGRHGKAWGIAHKDGIPIAEAAKRISGVHKRCWRYVSGLPSSSEIIPTRFNRKKPPAEV